MRNILFFFVLLSLGSFVIISRADAAGFALPEQGAAAMGMGSAFVGQADDPSAVWYDPAGITQLDGTRLMGGFVLIYPDLKHENVDGTTDVSSRAIHVPAMLYATSQLNDTVALGFGINNPFGLSTDWHAGSKTREVATLSQVIATEFNPNVAFKVNDDLSLAAGVDYVYLSATLSNLQFLPSPPFPAPFFTDSRLSGSGDGWGGNVAARYRISDALSTGLSYRSRIKVDIEGTAQLNGVAAAPANTSITLPDLLQWGLSYKPSNAWTVNGDVGYTWWSTYDKIAISSSNPLFNGKTYEKRWKDVWNLRLGGQYVPAERWKLRVGYQYDQTPVPDSTFETRVPDADRQGVSVGTGYSIGRVTVDVAYLYLHFNKRSIGNSTADDLTTNPNSLNGTYKSEAHVAGLTVGYKF
jgi:long-chain fatty acid transport protein